MNQANGGKQMFGPDNGQDYPVVTSDGLGGLFIAATIGYWSSGDYALYTQHVNGAGQFDAVWSNAGYLPTQGDTQNYPALTQAEPGGIGTSRGKSAGMVVEIPNDFLTRSPYGFHVNRSTYIATTQSRKIVKFRMVSQLWKVAQVWKQGRTKPPRADTLVFRENSLRKAAPILATLY